MVPAVVGAQGSSGAEASARPRWLFWLWLAVFYASWTALVVVQGRWPLVAAHWPIALAMLFGSYVAGSTPMGGGSVAFPILVLVLGEPARLGRDFSLAIQSLGMGSAVLYMLVSGRALAWGVLRWAMLGSLVGTPLGLLLLSPFATEVQVKLLFCGGVGGLRGHDPPAAPRAGRAKRKALPPDPASNGRQESVSDSWAERVSRR